MILSGLYAQLAAQTGIQALLVSPAYSGAPAKAVNAFFFGAAGKQPPQRFLVINVLKGTPAATTLDLTTALKDGELQFDSYAENQLIARQLSQTVRDLLVDLVNFTLPEGTVITFTENTVDRDLGYEVGAESYVYRSTLRLSAMWTETGTPPPGPALHEGDGPPTQFFNNGDNYYDLLTGNLYEQVYGVWDLVGNIPTGGGGGDMNPSSNYHVVSAASTNAAVIKTAAGLVTGWKISNNALYPVYVKLFDKATAPALGSDVPKQTIGVQAGEDAEVSINGGLTYTTGIAIAITKGIADADATAVAAADCVVDVFYQ